MRKVLIVAFAALIGLTACGRRKQQQQQQELPENPPTGTVEARFQGTDSLAGTLHSVDISFYPAPLNKAIVRIDETVYDLAQYQTASGYGYRNADLDLRGKGEDAFLDFTDPARNDLTLRQIPQAQ
jgi:hypothetical protein